jgi:hypothetical protein
MVDGVSDNARPAAGWLRPGLAVPLPSAGPVAAVAWHALTGLREPAFAHARRRTLWLVAISVTLVVGQFALAGVVRDVAIVGGAALGTYAALRTAALTVLQRWQDRFEAGWLTGQSAALREAQFEVMRFAVGSRTYDLTDPGAVGELLRLDDDSARVMLEVKYSSLASERVYRRLCDAEFRPVLRHGAQSQALFPQARYGVQPSGTMTYWFLGAPVVISVAGPADPGAPRAGTGSKGRPGAALRVDERLQGMS